MWPDVENGSVKWELVRFLEPTQIVSVRAADNPNKSGNDIAQVIARIHSLQVCKTIFVDNPSSYYFRN